MTLKSRITSEPDMRQRRRIVGVMLLALVGSLLGPGLTGAQVDLNKVLVGKWEGEIQQLLGRGANPGVVLVISSVKEDGGRWISDARAGTSTSGLGPVKVEIDNSGKQPSLRWTGGTGIAYNVNLFDEKSLVGTATLPLSMAGRGPRDRSVKLEKKE